MKEKLMAIYQWIVYLHVLAGFTFFFSHGASASMAFRLRKEHKVERIRALLDLSGYTIMTMFLSLLVLLVAGVVAGFMGKWWNKGWIWASLVLSVAIVVLMFKYGRQYYSPVRRAVGLPYWEGSKEHPAVDPASAEEIATAIAATRPVRLAVIGYGGLALILWLMMFKPF
jgi:hypothetical protein